MNPGMHGHSHSLFLVIKALSATIIQGVSVIRKTWQTETPLLSSMFVKMTMKKVLSLYHVLGCLKTDWMSFLVKAAAFYLFNAFGPRFLLLISKWGLLDGGTFVISPVLTRLPLLFYFLFLLSLF